MAVVLNRIRSFVLDARRWWTDHEAAWHSTLALDPDGQTPFQRECQRRVEAYMHSQGLELLYTGSRLVADPGDPSPWVLIHAEVPTLQAEFWFQCDQVGILANDLDFRLEHDAVRLPEDYYEELERFLLLLRPVENAT